MDSMRNGPTGLQVTALAMYYTPNIVTVSLMTTFGFSTLLGLVIVVQSYYYFSSSVSFFQIPDSLRDLTQPVYVPNGLP
jgi:hypothetical protein